MIISGKRIEAFSEHNITSLCTLLQRSSSFLGKTSITSGIMNGTTTTLVVLKRIKRLRTSIIDHPTLSLFTSDKMHIDCNATIPRVVGHAGAK